jgi:hypothetical protein
VAGEIRVVLTDELGDELIRRGFEESLGSRSVLADAGTVMTITSTGLSVGASVCIIVVSRTDLRSFVDGIRDWVLGKAKGRREEGGHANEIKISASAKTAQGEARAEVEVSYTDGTPNIDTSALAALLTSLFPDSGEDAAGDAPTAR